MMTRIKLQQLMLGEICQVQEPNAPSIRYRIAQGIELNWFKIFSQGDMSLENKRKPVRLHDSLILLV